MNRNLRTNASKIYTVHTIIISYANAELMADKWLGPTASYMYSMANLNESFINIKYTDIAMHCLREMIKALWR
jgi:hypothetical protein